MRGFNLFVKSITLVACAFICLNGSCPKVCEYCIECISYDSEFNLINEQIECSMDTFYLEGYKEGFMLGASSEGWNSICIDRGEICQ